MNAGNPLKIVPTADFHGKSSHGAKNRCEKIQIENGSVNMILCLFDVEWHFQIRAMIVVLTLPKVYEKYTPVHSKLHNFG